MSKELTPLVYREVTIHERDEMLCLTDMWKADGSRSSRRPSLWRQLPATQNLIAAFQETVGKSYSNIFATSEGRNGGTWAHWQLAIAYAQYLSPEFHLWCNKVVRAHMEGKPFVEAEGGDADDLRARVEILEGRLSEITTFLERTVTTFEGKVAEIANIDLRKTVTAPFMSYMSNLQKGYLDKRFYNIAERDDDARSLLETLVDDTTTLRTQMGALTKAMAGSSAQPTTNRFVAINEVMSRVKIREKRPRGLSMALSLSLQDWCSVNGRGMQRRLVSSTMTRRFFDEASVDQWWNEVGQKRFGKYLEKA